MRGAILVFAREPTPGRVKTRLTPPLSPEGAARLYEAFVEDVVERAGRVPGADVVLLGDEARAGAPRLAALARAAGVTYAPQRGADLGARLRAGLAETLSAPRPYAIALGADHPTIPAALLGEMAARLAAGAAAAVIPSEDGGYCAIGFRSPLPDAFTAIPWSTPRVLEATLDALRRQGVAPALLTAWRDVDTPPDLARLANEIAALDPGDGDFPAATARALRAARIGAEPRGPAAGTGHRRRGCHSPHFPHPERSRSMKLPWNRMAFSGLFALVGALALAIAASPAPASAKEPRVARVQSDDAPAPEASAPEETGARAWLGVRLQEIDEDLASALKLEDERGALVRQVEDESPAAAAGIEKGDVIVGIDGRAVTAPGDVVRMIGDLDPGKDVRLDVIRLGKEQTLTARLAPRPAAVARAPRRAPDAPDAPDMPGMPESPEWSEAPEPPGPGEILDLEGGPDRMMFRGPRAYLGVRLESLDEDLAKYFGARGKGGALVMHVEEKGPAANAGIRSGDVILRVDGEKVSEPADVIAAMREKDPGDEVALVVLRERRERTISVEAGEAERRVEIRRRIIEPLRERMHDMRREMRQRAPQARDALREQMDRLRDEMEKLRQEVERLKEKAN